MIALGHITLFTVLAVVAFLASLAGVATGIARWRKPYGKVVFAVSASILLIMAIAVILVLVTVAMGTMG